MCFAMIHRTGNRRDHTYKKLEVKMKTYGKVKTANVSNGDMDIEVILLVECLLYITLY
jgi:hypothetical protein